MRICLQVNVKDGKTVSSCISFGSPGWEKGVYVTLVVTLDQLAISTNQTDAPLERNISKQKIDDVIS